MTEIWYIKYELLVDITQHPMPISDIPLIECYNMPTAVFCDIQYQW
jgi:hypothetical protein